MNFASEFRIMLYTYFSKLSDLYQRVHLIVNPFDEKKKSYKKQNGKDQETIFKNLAVHNSKMAL